MSNTDLNYHFKQFGNKMQTLGILALLSFIFGLIANFVAVVGIINFIILIITLIVLFSALSEAREAGYKLNNRLLIEFRSKIVTAFILFLVGYFFLIGGTIGLAAVLYYTESIAAVAALAGVLVIAIIILIIAAIFRIQGWSRLQTFMVENGSMFPPNIASDAETGAKLMKIAGILYLTIILIIIAFILEVIGYFKLSSLKNLSGEARAPVARTQPVPAQPSPVAQPQSAKKFCPNCGAQVAGSEKFCPSCGSEL